MSDHYAVIGNPVAHSKSPQIHAAFARQTGQDMVYDRLLAPLDAFAATARQFFGDGGKGLNVTVPFKRAAWEMVNAHAGGARDAEAVNTIKSEGDKLVGYNTDGIGLVTDIERNLGAAIRGKRVLLMGAGGATYGVMHPLLEIRPDLLVVANRTLDKALSLVKHFQKFEPFAPHGISARPYAGLAGTQFDLVINATSAGLSGEMPSLPEGVFAPGALAYDMVYGRDTPFLAFARQRGVRAVDGLGMLVEQAAESFQIWRGVRPQTAPVIAQLRGST
ncbi:MAG: shikimate dehydrogenase [Burkholderiales bacterium]|nr:shikimate dehydrogenase [Burkholderiales bacterium]